MTRRLRARQPSRGPTAAAEAAELVGRIEAQLDLLDCPAVHLQYRELALGRAGTG
ncbi:hypothetical protein ACWGCW_06015 [Streptomyces sp. NPDC054933]